MDGELVGASVIGDDIVDELVQNGDKLVGDIDII